MSNDVEREFSLDEAERRIDRFVHAEGLSWRLRMHGERHGVCLARLTRGQDVIHRGAGKGKLRSALVGGKYEAVEHWLTERWGGRHACVVPVDKAAEQTTTDHLPMALLREQPGARIACRTYTRLGDGATTLQPLSLALPGYERQRLAGDTFDYRHLRRYASNSGTAMGGNVAEATLHALNECIERDALSLFLLTHFYYRSGSPVRRVDLSQVPDDLGVLIDDIRGIIGAEVVLLNISTGFGVTTCLAFAHATYDGPHVYGAGASLNPIHAAYRALSELLQVHLAVSNAWCGDDLALAQASLRGFPALYRALMFSVNALQGSSVESERLDGDVRRPLDHQIEMIVEALASRGFHAAACVLGETAEGLALVNVTVPGFERFFVVGSGNVVLPGGRGKLAAQTA